MDEDLSRLGGVGSVVSRLPLAPVVDVLRDIENGTTVPKLRKNKRKKGKLGKAVDCERCFVGTIERRNLMRSKKFRLSHYSSQITMQISLLILTG